MAKVRRFFAQDENLVAGLPGGTDYATQAGRTDTDDGTVIERGSTLPLAAGPDNTWLAYHNRLGVLLDAGMALHKPLPQTPGGGVDTLASVDAYDPAAQSASKAGVNLASDSPGSDVIQRMSTSTYTFYLEGFAVRLGLQIPIPGLVSVAGVAATPSEVQRVEAWADGNYGGVPLFYAKWRLEYYVTLPPRSAQVPPANIAARVRGDAQLPANGPQAPYGVPDQNANAGGLSGFFTGGQRSR